MRRWEGKEGKVINDLGLRVQVLRWLMLKYRFQRMLPLMG
jgi:hypothetical protein